MEAMGYEDEMEKLKKELENAKIKIEEMKQEIENDNIKIEIMKKKLEESELQTERAYLENIETLRYAEEVRNPYTRGHSERVSKYAVLIGNKMNLSDEEIRILRVGGLFHDIGKIGTPDSILLKESKLSDEEYDKIKRHPLIGAEILSNSQGFKDILPIVKYHHERFDGGGYPENLKGEEIPLLARITAVADSFDAMNSRRTYRDRLDLDKIVSEIEAGKGTQFDPDVVDAFLDILKNDFESVRGIQESYL